MGIVMDIIDHGEWVACDKPDDYPAKLPSHIMFARRVSDGVDWYRFQRETLAAPDTIKLTAMQTEDGLMVLTTTLDASMLFPTGGVRLFEVRGAPADHESLRMQRLDLDKQRFVPPPPPPPTMLDVVMEELGLDAAQMQTKLDAALKNRRSHG